MILYFSGTGNSAYVAKRIGKMINDEVVHLFEKIKDNDFSPLQSKRPWVIVVPTYAWRIPCIVEHWLKNTPLQGNQDIYFVMTCGGSIGNAGKYIEKLCQDIKMNNRGCMEIIMPENYIAMFSTPTKEEASKIIGRAEKVIDLAAVCIKNGQSFKHPKVSFNDKISSSVINKLFYPLFVHAKKFYVLDDCISCGKCANVCPLHNIQLSNGKPVWGNQCTHCMACISRCPKEAIEYGKHSKGLPRYTCENVKKLEE